MLLSDRELDDIVKQTKTGTRLPMEHADQAFFEAARAGAAKLNIPFEPISSSIQRNRRLYSFQRTAFSLSLMLRTHGSESALGVGRMLLTRERMRTAVRGAHNVLQELGEPSPLSNAMLKKLAKGNVDELATSSEQLQAAYQLATKAVDAEGSRLAKTLIELHGREKARAYMLGLEKLHERITVRTMI